MRFHYELAPVLSSAIEDGKLKYPHLTRLHRTGSVAAKDVHALRANVEAAVVRCMRVAESLALHDALFDLKGAIDAWKYTTGIEAAVQATLAAASKEVIRTAVEEAVGPAVKAAVEANVVPAVSAAMCSAIAPAVTAAVRAAMET